MTVTPVGFTETPWSVFFPEFLHTAGPWSYVITLAHAQSVVIDYPKLCTKHLLTILAMCKELSHMTNSSSAGTVSTNCKCVIHVQFSQFYSQNCLGKFLEWPGSPPRTLIIILKHENNAQRLDYILQKLPVGSSGSVWNSHLKYSCKNWSNALLWSWLGIQSNTLTQVSLLSQISLLFHLCRG